MAGSRSRRPRPERVLQPRGSDAAFNCPGGEDLERALSAAQLVGGLDASFAIVERCLDAWTADALNEVLRHPEWGPGREHSRGFLVQRVFGHDISQVTEPNEALTTAGLPIVDLWG